MKFVVGTKTKGRKGECGLSEVKMVVGNVSGKWQHSDTLLGVGITRRPSDTLESEASTVLN